MQYFGGLSKKVEFQCIVTAVAKWIFDNNISNQVRCSAQNQVKGCFFSHGPLNRLLHESVCDHVYKFSHIVGSQCDIFPIHSMRA